MVVAAHIQAGLVVHGRQESRTIEPGFTERAIDEEVDAGEFPRAVVFDEQAAAGIVGRIDSFVASRAGVEREFEKRAVAETEIADGRNAVGAPASHVIVFAPHPTLAVVVDANLVAAPDAPP